MQAMTDEEVKDFVKRNEWATGIKIDDRDLYYDQLGANCIHLKFPETPSRVPYFSRVLSLLGIEEEGLFYGAVLWLRLWNIGSPQLEKTGWKVVEKMRLGFGETRPISVAPGHSFRSDELIELNAFILPCFIFGWDAYIIPAGNDFFVHISHDEFWTVITKSDEVHTKLFRDLKDLNPEPAHPNGLERFCRKKLVTNSSLKLSPGAPSFAKQRREPSNLPQSCTSSYLTQSA